MKLNRTLAGATAGAAVLVLGAAGTAMAATPATVAASAPATCSPSALAYVQARVDLAVAHRELTITDLTADLARRSHVTDIHRSTLSAVFVGDAAGLRTVDATVHADTTCKQAVTDGRTVVSDYRVYMLVVPATHLVAGSDTGTYAAGRLTVAEPRLQAGIAAITDPTKKAQAQSAYDDLVAQTTSATDDFSGVGDVVLGLKPADMPAAAATLATERAKVASGRAALATALKDAATIAALLA